MVSIKQRTREHLFHELKDRTSKFATMLDDSDLTRHLNRALLKLNEVVYMPRTVLFNRDAVKEGSHYLIDVTDLKVEVITKGYFSPGNDNATTNNLLPEIGIVPLILNGGTSILSSFSDFSYYQIVINNLSRFSRMANMSYDFELLPMDSQGKSYLQLRNLGTNSDLVFWMEYLPFIDKDADVWYIYDAELDFLQDLAYYYCLEASTEYNNSAEVLGVKAPSKDYSSKIKELIDEFKSESLVIALY